MSLNIAEGNPSPRARTIQRKAQYSHVVEYYAAKEMAILEPRCIMGNGHVVT